MNVEAVGNAEGCGLGAEHMQSGFQCFDAELLVRGGWCGYDDGIRIDVAENVVKACGCDVRAGW